MPSVRVSVRGGRIVVSVPGRRGLPGTSGWTPILAIVNDGARRVHRVVDYTGGTGTKPATGLYVGPTGLVANIADAVDIGASGVGGAVTSVAGRNGDVVLTKADVGLGSVDNTADLNKPVSTLQAAADTAVANAAAADATAKAGAAQAAAIAAAATDATAKANAARAAAELTASTALSAHAAAADPHSGYQLKSGKDQPDGYAGVGGDGKIPAALLPSIAIVEYLGAVGSQSAMLALVGQKGDWCTRTDTGMTWIITGNDPTQISSWIPLSYPAAPVTTVAGRNGDVVLTRADVGLNNVDNTADLSKPVSTAQASADAAVATQAANALSAHEAAPDPHTGYQLKTEKGVANGYASLDSSGRVPPGQLPPSGSIGGTLGATDNALTRADGTGGNTAQGSGVTLDDTATLLATNWTVTSGTFGGRTFARFGSGGSNLALVLSPTGTGFIASQVPDGTTTGGNLRGNNAIDFCYSRSAATQVASGVGSFNGGTSSTASGASSFAWCGQATNGLTFAMFGNATGNWSISIGQATSSTANGSLAAGEGAQATGDYSAAFCYSIASGPHSVATGNRSLASLYGQFAHASGRFVSNGDCQSVLLMARAATTDATPTTLFLDGASQRFLVPANSRGRMRITAIAATSTAGGEMMTWSREVAWWRGVAASTTEVDVQTIGTDRGRTGGLWGLGPPWGFAITPDTTNGGFNCAGTGAGATNIRWSMRADIVMEVFP